MAAACLWQEGSRAGGGEEAGRVCGRGMNAATSSSASSSVSSSQSARFARPWQGQQLRRGDGREETQDGGYSEGRTVPCLVWGGSSPSMRVSPTPRGRSCPVPHRGRQRHRRHLPSPRPPHHGCSPPCPTKVRFAAPTLGLAMAPRQTLGGKEEFSSWKTHPEHNPMVAAPRQPLSVVVLPLPGALPWRNAATPGMAARSTDPSSGPSTPKTHHHCENRVFSRETWRWGASARGGGMLSPVSSTGKTPWRRTRARAKPFFSTPLFAKRTSFLLILTTYIQSDCNGKKKKKKNCNIQ